MALLIHNESMPFTVLKKELDLTDGNLSSHLKKLYEVEYINISKEFINNRPKTNVIITNIGREAFKIYIKQLKSFIKQNKCNMK